jgi:hypothetical protein
MIDDLLKEVKAEQEDQGFALRSFQSAYDQQESVCQQFGPMNPDSGDARRYSRHIQQAGDQLEEQADKLGERHRRTEKILQKIRDEEQRTQLTAQQKILFKESKDTQIQLEKALIEKEANFSALKGAWQAKQAEVQSASGHLPGGLTRRFFDHAFMGIRLKETIRGDYFNITASGQMNPYTGMRTMSDRQLRETILRLVKQQTEKGVSDITLYCYHGNKIDQQLTQRAKGMVMNMSFPGHVLDGFQVRVSPSRMKELEPWRSDNALTRAFNKLQKWNDDRLLEKADRKEIKGEKRYPWSPFT